ncbi:MAG: family 20 glycosylhydrolase [Bacteroidia bacterium]|nr:family 20 glycosylhydrolase [Bacteroidia bacterium]
MRTNLIFIASLFQILILSCSDKVEMVEKIAIIPAPDQLVLSEGSFMLNGNSKVYYDKGLEVPARFLMDFVRSGSGISMDEGTADSDIIFKLKPELGAEEYVLEVTTNNINIYASEARAAFYAVQSLRQLMSASLEKGEYSIDVIAIPLVKITDEPRFGYRGMHLDVGRHMFPVDFIKKYIDALALLKYNRFHWHLTEDQGWRVEIKQYPKLNEVASFRNETLVGHYSDQPHQFDAKTYGGFYTQDEIRDIVKYAADRFITIIPEIEMPGHSQAVIAAYPELGCTGEPVEVATKWGVFEHIYCSKEETFTFLENVLDEVLELFPSEYIHIGGDEAPKKNWEACKNCQARISSEGLKDEHELQSYFISRMESYLNDKGRQIIGWDEILEGGLAPNATVMSWRGQSGGIDAANMGHEVVMTPTSHCYFDYYQAETESEPLAIGGYLPLRKVYDFEPVPDELSADKHKYIIGAQGNVWTEYMKDEKQVEYMVFPRILALSEVLWRDKSKKDFTEFVGRTNEFFKRLDALEINYANHLYQLNGAIKNENGTGYLEIRSELKDADIFYTLDGAMPAPGSKKYDGPMPIEKSLQIKAAVFDEEGERLGQVFQQSIEKHKAFLKTPILNKEPHPSYNAGGAKALTNGINGSDKRYGDSEWLGFWGEDLRVVIDLGETTELKRISTRFFNSKGQWIYPPEKMLIKTDTENIDLNIDDQGDRIIDVVANLQSATRYIELTIPNYGIIKEGRQGQGNPAWTFIDEIKIE